MGIINCKIHGRQPIIEICEHAYAAIKNNSLQELKSIPILGLRI